MAIRSNLLFAVGNPSRVNQQPCVITVKGFDDRKNSTKLHVILQPGKNAYAQFRTGN
jgi:hypothetical protein